MKDLELYDDELYRNLRNLLQMEDASVTGAFFILFFLFY
jgi:hypothetical protein